MKKFHQIRAFTLIELLVVISIIAVLAGIALPVFSQVQVKGAQTKALSNAKQIGLAMKLYATDNNGNFPSYTLDASMKPTTTQVSDSNTAFAQLIPDYIPSEDVFWLAKSKWCSTNPPDNQIDNPPVQTPVKTLKGGENEWALVLGLTDTSNPSFPLIADGFTSNALGHAYSKDETVPGGVWKGKQAIVIHCDASGAIMKVDQTSLQIKGPNGGTTDGDIFSTANSTNSWLGSTNITVNPKTSQ